MRKGDPGGGGVGVGSVCRGRGLVVAVVVGVCSFGSGSGAPYACSNTLATTKARIAAEPTLASARLLRLSMSAICARWARVVSCARLPSHVQPASGPARRRQAHRSRRVIVPFAPNAAAIAPTSSAGSRCPLSSRCSDPLARVRRKSHTAGTSPGDRGMLRRTERNGKQGRRSPSMRSRKATGLGVKLRLTADKLQACIRSRTMGIAMCCGREQRCQWLRHAEDASWWVLLRRGAIPELEPAAGGRSGGGWVDLRRPRWWWAMGHHLCHAQAPASTPERCILPLLCACLCAAPTRTRCTLTGTVYPLTVTPTPGISLMTANPDSSASRELGICRTAMLTPSRVSGASSTMALRGANARRGAVGAESHVGEEGL